jgi:hypothetical protein
MMHTLSNFKNQFKRFRLFIDNMNPHMQWMALLRFFFVVCFCLIAASFYLLYQIKSEQIFQIKKASVSTNTVNQTLYQTVTKALQARLQAQNAVRTSADVADPSL